jgi:hypothetical protein
MIEGRHLAIGGAIVLMPDGSPRLQLVNGHGWVQIELRPSASDLIRKHLSLPILATEPQFTHTEEPLKQRKPQDG